MAFRVIFFFLMGFACAGEALSQSSLPGDTIRIVNNPLSGVKFYQGNQKISMSGLQTILHNDPVASGYLKRAKTNNTIATVLGFIGGACLGYELGSALGGGKTNSTVLGVGIGCIAVAIPFSISGNKNSKRAVHTYNTGLH